MAATKVETMTTPRDSLPNVYTGVTARELDFVTRFADNWEALREIYGIMRPIRKQAGTSLVSYTASIALESGTVPAGAVIPYSKTTITQATKEDITLQKYAKAVPIEDVDKYGATIAVQKSDDAFLTKLQNEVMSKFYTFLNTGSLTGRSCLLAGRSGEGTGRGAEQVCHHSEGCDRSSRLCEHPGCLRLSGQCAGDRAERFRPDLHQELYGL